MGWSTNPGSGPRPPCCSSGSHRVRKGTSLATANKHKVLLTFPQRTGDATPNASDTTTGKIWLWDRNDRPVSSDAVVAGPEGAAIALGAGALIQEWSLTAVNLDHSVNSQDIGAFVTNELWANVGTTVSPSDHILVDGKDGSYYVAEVTYTPATGKPRTARFEFQVSASVDYETNGNTVTISGAEVVLVTVLDDRTFGTGDVESMVLGLLPAATTTSSGVVELATQAETDAGTDTSRVVTPETLASRPFAGDVTGDIDATVVADDSHDHTSATLPAADETTAGVLETATAAEVTAGTATDKAVTPATVDDITLTGDVSGTAGATVVGDDSHSHTDSTLPAADETTAGVLETATAAEVTAGTATDKAVTPSTVDDITLAGDVTGTTGATVVGNDSHDHTSATLPAADTFTAGVIETATQAETDAGTATDKAVTPDTLDAYSPTAAGKRFLVGHEYNEFTNAARSIHVELTGVPSTGSNCPWLAEVVAISSIGGSDDEQPYVKLLASGRITATGNFYKTDPVDPIGAGTGTSVSAADCYVYEHSTNGTPVIRFDMNPRFMDVFVYGWRSSYADGADWAAGIDVSETATTDADL